MMNYRSSLYLFCDVVCGAPAEFDSCFAMAIAGAGNLEYIDALFYIKALINKAKENGKRQNSVFRKILRQVIIDDIEKKSWESLKVPEAEAREALRRSA